MTLMGAIKQLHELRSAEDMPIYYKPAIAEVINVLLMDTQEVRHGRWEVVDGAEPRRFGCSVCKKLSWTEDNFCSYCGAKMDGERREDGKTA